MFAFLSFLHREKVDLKGVIFRFVCPEHHEWYRGPGGRLFDAMELLETLRQRFFTEPRSAPFGGGANAAALAHCSAGIGVGGDGPSKRVLSDVDGGLSFEVSWVEVGDDADVELLFKELHQLDPTARESYYLSGNEGGSNDRLWDISKIMEDLELAKDSRESLEKALGITGTRQSMASSMRSSLPSTSTLKKSIRRSPASANIRPRGRHATE